MILSPSTPKFIDTLTLLRSTSLLVAFSNLQPFFSTSYFIVIHPFHRRLLQYPSRWPPLLPQEHKMTSTVKESHEQRQLHQQISLPETLDRAHEALSTILTATPFSTTDEALDQTSAHLDSTARYLKESSDNVVRSQNQLATLVSRIQYVKEFLPEDGHLQRYSDDDEEEEEVKK